MARMNSLLIALASVTAFAFAPGGALAQSDSSSSAPGNTMVFRPVDASFDSSKIATYPAALKIGDSSEGDWLRAPIGDNLLTHPDPWRAQHTSESSEVSVQLDYNRVDLLRYGLWYQAQAPATMFPRLGGRLEYATGRKRVLYGAQLEQPLLPTARFVTGLSMVRRTDHGDLQQVDDFENSLALLAVHEDWRDYFEREGLGAYLSWRVPDFSTVSVHIRRDDYRSLSASTHVHSWFRGDRTLRGNPVVDEGESHSALVRLERLTQRKSHKRAGVYHWIELERSGGQMGGDFDYSRGLADLRSIFRLSPALTLSLRGVAGATLQGELPRQRQFVIGGVDGMRAHPFGALRGNQVAMLQAEYAIGLWQLRSGGFQEGMHAFVFADAGTAWDGPARWDVDRQKFGVDGGIGLSTSDDHMRLTFARDLQDPSSKFVASVRLQRPF